MAVLLLNKEIKIIRKEIVLADFTRLLAKHCAAGPRKGPTTAEVEQLALAYIADGFRANETANFVKSVCSWGNYAGVYGKVLKRNTIGVIRSQLEKAHQASSIGDAKQAIKEVTILDGLGVSFGSKHLRFLTPRTAVVLDRIISERLGYQRTVEGYAEFVQDCLSARDILNQNGVPASKNGAPWRACDVEASIYMSLLE